MKTLVALSLLSLFGCHCQGTKLPDGMPFKYEYRYSGTMQYPIDWYRVEIAEDGRPRILVSHNSDDILILRAPEDIFQRIDTLVRQYRLDRLKDSYEPPVEVFDGYSWSMRIRYPESQEVSSGGYNFWPDKELRDGIKAINEMLQGIIDSASEKDILGHESHDNY